MFYCLRRYKKREHSQRVRAETKLILSLSYISNIPMMQKLKQKSGFVCYMISYHCEDVNFFITLQLCC